MNNNTSRGLKILAIVIMGMTAAMNVLGGSGTICAAFLTKKFPPMWVFMDYQLLYQFLMIATILIGIAGIWATVKLIKGEKNILRWTLIILAIGTVLGGTQYFASMAIRGKGVPANVKFYINLAALILFLIIRFTKLGEKVDFSTPNKKADNTMAGGLTAFISGLAVLSVFIWAGPSHTYNGVNWVELYSTPIIFSGALLLAIAFTLIIWSFFQMVNEERVEAASKLT